MCRQFCIVKCPWLTLNSNLMYYAQSRPEQACLSASYHLTGRSLMQIHNLQCQTNSKQAVWKHPGNNYSKVIVTSQIKKKIPLIINMTAIFFKCYSMDKKKKKKKKISSHMYCNKVHKITASNRQLYLSVLYKKKQFKTQLGWNWDLAPTDNTWGWPHCHSEIKYRQN